jgi:hypothetical protein
LISTRKCAKIATKSTMKLKTLIGLAALTDQNGVALCGGAAAKQSKMLQVVNFRSI